MKLKIVYYQNLNSLLYLFSPLTIIAIKISLLIFILQTISYKLHF